MSERRDDLLDGAVRVEFELVDANFAVESGSVHDLAVLPREPVVHDAPFVVRAVHLQNLVVANPIRLPLNRIHTGLRIKKAEEDLVKKLNRRPTIEELAEGAMMKPQELSKFLRDIPNVISMDSTPVDNDEDLYLRDVITDSESDPSVETEKKALNNELNDLLQSLTERERIVLQHRFGLGDIKPYTLEEIGKLLGVTRERVRQIECQALDKLRNPRRSEFLHSFLN